MATLWVDDLPVFPDWVLGDISCQLEWKTQIITTKNYELRTVLWNNSRRIFDVSKATLIDSQVEIIEAFSDSVRGMQNEFLFFDGILNQVHQTVNVDGDIAKPFQDLATGVGTVFNSNQDFPLARELSIQGRTIKKRIRYLDHDFPAIYDARGEVWRAPSEFKIYDSNQNRLAPIINRLDGTVNFHNNNFNGVSLKAIGYFYNRVRCTKEKISYTKVGNGVYRISSGIQFVEPKGAI